MGFAARPIGGIVFGHYGDRIGRKSMLVLSLLIMGVATFLIGVLPTYASIGVVAPILLVVLRFAQGIGVGGEWGGAVLMSVEHAPKGRRGFFGSWPQMGVPAGLLLSTGVFALVQAMHERGRVHVLGLARAVPGQRRARRRRPVHPPEDDGVAGVRARQGDQDRGADKPIVDVVRKYPREVLVAMGMRVAENGCFYILTVFVLAYGEEELGLARARCSRRDHRRRDRPVTVPLWGALSDRVGRKPLYLAGAVITTLWAFPLFGLIDTESPVLIWLSIAVGINLGHDLMYGPQAAYFSELFGRACATAARRSATSSRRCSPAASRR